MTKRGVAFVGACSLVVAVSASAGETLVSYTVDESSYSIPRSLSGDPGTGRKLVTNRNKGNCLACHTLPIPEQPFRGRIAPPLNGIGARYDVGQLRLRVVDPKLLNPMTIMPAFYKVDGLHRVDDKFAGKPILNAQEVEDVVAYLATLK